MKEYKRLTKKFENGYVMADCSNCPSCNKCDNITHYCQTTIKERLAELEDKIEQGLMVELPKPKWAVVQGMGGTYFVREREPKATYYNGKWHFYYETIEWVDIRFEYETKAEAKKKLNELKGGVK